MAAVRLGLTGGIGSGKSTVARMLCQQGAALIDADAISRELTAPQGLAMASIAEFFGVDFVGADGALNRDKMRALAYADPTARKRLEAIIHPLVKQESEHRVAQAQSQGCACIVFDIPLLVESGSWRQRLDHVLVIDCPSELQISRVMARSGLNPSEVQAIIASQASRERRLAAADTVIFNIHSTLDELAAELCQIFHRFGLSCMPPPEQ